jgi:hypothetical protein
MTDTIEQSKVEGSYPPKSDIAVKQEIDNSLSSKAHKVSIWMKIGALIYKFIALCLEISFGVLLGFAAMWAYPDGLISKPIGMISLGEILLTILSIALWSGTLFVLVMAFVRFQD